MDRVDDFFAFARERHACMLRRQAGQPWPWTQDAIIRDHHFTCVFREMDRSTRWVRHHVREPYHVHPEILLLAVVVARWFNRTEVLEPMFCERQIPLDRPHRPFTAFEHFYETGEVGLLSEAALRAAPRGPWVTGAYMLRSPTGMPKLPGMLKLCRDFWHADGWRGVARKMARDDVPWTLESFTRWLQRQEGQGPFLAYEVACDLLHTPLLDRAADRMTWCNVGPGALIGLSRVMGRRNDRPQRRKRYEHRVSVPEAQALEEIRGLLAMSRDPTRWAAGPDHPEWDMRTVEHTLCEFAKYCSAKDGARLKRRYRPPTGSLVPRPGPGSVVAAHNG